MLPQDLIHTFVIYLEVKAIAQVLAKGHQDSVEQYYSSYWNHKRLPTTNTVAFWKYHENRVL